jgi:hypothetical protein
MCQILQHKTIYKICRKGILSIWTKSEENWPTISGACCFNLSRWSFVQRGCWRNVKNLWCILDQLSFGGLCSLRHMLQLMTRTRTYGGGAYNCPRARTCLLSNISNFVAHTLASQFALFNHNCPPECQIVYYMFVDV